MIHLTSIGARAVEWARHQRAVLRPLAAQARNTLADLAAGQRTVTIGGWPCSVTLTRGEPQRAPREPSDLERRARR